jgi:hypothetical protein
VLREAVECVRAGEAQFDRPQVGNLLSDAHDAADARPGAGAQLTDRGLQIIALRQGLVSTPMNPPRVEWLSVGTGQCQGCLRVKAVEAHT